MMDYFVLRINKGKNMRTMSTVNLMRSMRWIGLIDLRMSLHNKPSRDP